MNHLTEDQRIDREIAILCAEAVMRMREAMEELPEFMLDTHRKQRAAYCARQRSW
jgi:hypothetical protein